MQRLEVGKLYSCSGYYLMLYPDKETAVFAGELGADLVAANAAADAAYWSKRFDKHVSYCNTETPLLVLNTKGEYIEVLAGDKRGWIIYQGWLELKEIYA